MSSEVQELHSFGTKPAADLKAHNNKPAAPHVFELRVRLMSLASAANDTQIPEVEERGPDPQNH